MSHETALGNAFKTAVQNISKRKQTEMISEYIYKKYDVFKQCKPLAVGLEEELIAAMPQFQAALIVRVLGNHCRRPRYIKAIASGGKRFDLRNKVKGKVSPEEQENAAQNPVVKEMMEKIAAKKATDKPAVAEQTATENPEQAN